MDIPCECDANGNPVPSGTGDPINLLTGAVFEEATDFTTKGPERLSVQRHYSSNISYAEALPAAYNSALAPYSAITQLAGRFGYNWRSQYDRYIAANGGLSSSTTVVDAIRADGTPVHFTYSGTAWFTAYWIPGTGWSSSTDPRHSTNLTFSHDTGYTHWYITDENDTVETYDSTGKLTTIAYRDGYQQTLTYDSTGNNTGVSDTLGRSLTFHYLANGLVDTVTDPTGGVTQYAYVDRSGFVSTSGTPALWMVQKVTYPDTKFITYLYEDTHPINRFALTGIIDENNNRYATWGYDSTTGRATSNQMGNGTSIANAVTITYDDVHNTRTVTNALGKQTVYNLAAYQGSYQISSKVDQASGSTPASTVSYGYDSGTGYLLTKTSGESRVTTYTHNSIGQETSRTEGYGTAQARTIATTWDSTYHLPDTICISDLSSFLLRTDYTYTTGLLTKLTQTDITSLSSCTLPIPPLPPQRIWNYTYYTSPDPSAGLLKTVEGPFGAGDTITYAYSGGYVSSVTNQVGHVTTITSVNGWGEPLTSVDPNSVTTNYTYDLRGRLKSITRNPGASAAVTSFTYDSAGEIQVITLPDSSTLTYGYDTSHRLASVTNNLGESITYTLNAMGGRTETDTKNASSTITKKQTATFDDLNRVLTELGASSQTTTHGYDRDNNETSTKDPRLKLYGHAFDALNRLYQETDPDTYQTTTAYNGKDDVTSVTDARTHATTYVRDGFGDITSQTSPDTGTTTMSYDALGDLTKKIDSRGNETDFTYDTTGRVLTRKIHGITTENVTFTYDTVVSGQYNVDHLRKIADPSGSTTFNYNQLAQVTKETRIIGANTYGVSFTYDPAGHTKVITYPSGRTVTYTRDALGRISNIATKTPTTSTVTVASSVTYKPFGPLAGLTFGNSVVLALTYDQDYELTGINAAKGATVIQNLTNGYDADGNISPITDTLTPARTQSFTYDDLNRLKTASGLYGSLTFGYDSVGNRLTLANGTSTDTYAISPTSNRISTVTSSGSGNVRSFSYLATGQASGDTRNPSSAYVYTYNKTGRLASASLNGTTVGTYLMNGLEQRVTKTVGSTTTQFVFDRHGHLLAEANGATGATQKEYIWLDDLPVAEIDDTGSSPVIYYVHTDQLGRPQKMTDATATIVWDGVFDPFGNVTSVTGSATNLLMFPGQYYDSETQLSQNWNRDYDPSIGRYIQSDPVGLAGGVNTYAYVGGNPIKSTDTYGLIRTDNWFGFNDRDFQWWFHNCYKQKGDPDVSSWEEMAEAYDEYSAAGSPPRGRCWNNKKPCPDPTPAPKPAGEPDQDSDQPPPPPANSNSNTPASPSNGNPNAAIGKAIGGLGLAAALGYALAVLVAAL